MKTNNTPLEKKSFRMRFWISPLFFAMAAVLLFSGAGWELCGYIAILVIHEFAHAAVAKKLGYQLQRIKLMPYGASLSGEFDAIRPRDEILIALAGPAVNLLLAVITAAVWWIAPVSYGYTESFFTGNLTTAAFNILPLFPLDGGRVLLAGLGIKYRRQSVYKILRLAGLIASIVFAALFCASFLFVSNPSLAAISVFFFMSTVIPDKQSSYARLYSMAYLSQKIKRGIPVREVMVSQDTNLSALFKLLNGNYFTKFIVVDQALKTVAVLIETELESLGAKYALNLPVGRIVKNT